MPGYRPQRKYVAILAGVSALILIVGARFRPERNPETPISQTEMLRLQLTAQRRNLENLASYYANIANDVKSGLVWVRGVESSAVVWDDQGLLLTAGPTKPFYRTPTAGRHQLTPEIVSIHYPVGAFRAPEDAGFGALFHGSAEAQPQGSSIIQVAAKRDGHLHAPGTLEGVVTMDCNGTTVRSVETNIPLDERSAGGAIFDLQGILLGVVLRCNGSYAAVTPEGVERILDDARSFSGQLLRRYGLGVEALSEELQAYFGAERGLLVTDVWCNWPADRAGVLPGDIIQALDEAEVNAPEDLTRLLLPVAYLSFDVWVWRGGKTTRLTMPVNNRELPIDPGASTPGIVLRSPQEGYQIDDVAPGSRAEQAELNPGDRLLRIGGGQPRNLAAARRVLSEGAGEPVYVVVQRGQRKFGAYLR